MKTGGDTLTFISQSYSFRGSLRRGALGLEIFGEVVGRGEPLGAHGRTPCTGYAGMEERRR